MTRGNEGKIRIAEAEERTESTCDEDLLQPAEKQKTNNEKKNRTRTLEMERTKKKIHEPEPEVNTAPDDINTY
ncbi:hypothetical protein [uncultured Alistipes sp.]|uniref:hypothetical protein n=1 Tax=uncultured Alistipes sp. TaxID=538949 RepID=UPI0026F3CC56|nr:hypothetical protein [uncultured Alistipes sp.]